MVAERWKAKAVDSRCGARRIIASVEQKENFKGNERPTAYVTEHVVKVGTELPGVRECIFARMNDNLREAPMIQKVGKTIEFLQVQYIDEIIELLQERILERIVENTDILVPYVKEEIIEVMQHDLTETTKEKNGSAREFVRRS